MNDEKPIKNFTLTLNGHKPAGFIYVTMHIDPTTVIEDKLSKMDEFKEASDILSKFTLHGKN